MKKVIFTFAIVALVATFATGLLKNEQKKADIVPPITTSATRI